LLKFEKREETVMRVLTNASAGTLESSDIFVDVGPGKGITIELTSAVMQQFGDSIRQTIHDTAQRLGVTDVSIRAYDRGALDCVIQARTETALLRAGGAQ
jgi:citrate lyase subunit gamma (acyl carrier protein)